MNTKIEISVRYFFFRCCSQYSDINYISLFSFYQQYLTFLYYSFIKNINTFYTGIYNKITFYFY